MELKGFEAFLASPYFNSRKDLRELFQIIKSKKKKSQPISKDILIKELFPENYSNRKGETSSRDKTRLNNALSKLNAMAEQYLVQLTREKDDLDNRIRLIKQLMIRGLYPRARSILKREFDTLKDNSYSIQYSYDLFRLQEVQYELDVQQYDWIIEKDFQFVLSHFENYYMANSLLYCCALINNSRVVSMNYDHMLVEKLINSLQRGIESKPPIVKIYYYSLKYLNGELEYFEKAKYFAFEHKNIFNQKELRRVVNLALNFCQFQGRKGELYFIREWLGIFQKSLEIGLLDKDLRKPINKFVVYVSMGLLIYETDVVVQFISKYKNKLNPKYRKNILLLCNAEINFSTGDFEASLELILQFNERKYNKYSKGAQSYKVFKKNLLIKLYFELQKWHELERELEALRVFFYTKLNSKLSSSKKKDHLEFRRLTNKLYLCVDHPLKNEKILLLIREIKNSDALMSRSWLLQKAEFYLNK